MDNKNFGFRYRVRLDSLLRIAENILQNVFRERYQNLTGSKWRNDKQQRSEFFHKWANQAYKSFVFTQRKMLDNLNMETWDFHVLARILTDVEYAKNKNDKSSYTFENEYVTRLGKIRHDLGSNPSTIDSELTEQQFLEYYQNIREALIFGFDYPTDEIEDFRISTIDLPLLSPPPSSSCSSSSVASSISKFKDLMKDGNVAFCKQDYKKAAKIYSEAINLPHIPKDEKSNGYNARSFVYYKLCENEECGSENYEDLSQLSKNDALKSILFDPFAWRGYSRLAKSYELQKNWKKALESYNEAINLNPTFKELLQARDSCTLKMQEENNSTNGSGSKGKQSSSSCSKTARRKSSSNDSASQIGELVDPLSRISMFQVVKKLNDHANSYHEKAQTNIIKAFRNLCGVECPQNYKRAFHYFKKADESGDLIARTYVGLLYAQGKGVRQDVAKGVGIIEKTANYDGPPPIPEGVSEAMYNLAKCYFLGLGKEKSYAQARHWFEVASKNGNGQAAHELGNLYGEGRGVEVNWKTAVHYWKLGAERNVSESMESLAKYYIGTGQHEKAQFWYDKAIGKGQAEFRLDLSMLDQTSKEMDKGSSNSNDISLEDLLRSMFKADMEQGKRSSEKSKVIFKNHLDLENSQYILEIRERARRGHAYAQRLAEALNNFEIFSQLLRHLVVGYSGDFQMKRGIIRLLVNSLRKSDKMSLWSSELKHACKEIVNECLEKVETASTLDTEFDIELRICYCFLYLDSKTILSFCKNCVEKYPKEIMFRKCLAWSSQELEEGLKLTNESLQLFPRDYELLFAVASFSEILYLRSHGKKCSYSEVIRAYESYLREAPPQERCIFQAYYSMGVVCLMYVCTSLNMNDSEKKGDMLLKAKKYYDLGVKEEEQTFLYFRRNDSPALAKIILEDMLPKLQLES